jgi:putative folate metabolism gamma-glutamate ligase
MNIYSIKTDKIIAGSMTIFELLDKFLSSLNEGSVVAISSKVVSLCENNVVPIGSVDKEELIRREADYYMSAKLGKYGYHFTIKNNTLISMSGIDESNGNGNYVLWPKDSQKSANEIRQYLNKRFKLKSVGVVVTDSISTPLRFGSSGTALAYSGIEPLHNYIGQPDLFGRPFKMSRASMVGGLAATANMVMGEGDEPTPIIVMEDMPFIKFQDRDPTVEELESIHVPIDEDIYEPLINGVKWLEGDGGK